MPLASIQVVSPGSFPGRLIFLPSGHSSVVSHVLHVLDCKHVVSSKHRDRASRWTAPKPALTFRLNPGVTCKDQSLNRGQRLHNDPVGFFLKELGCCNVG